MTRFYLTNFQKFLSNSKEEVKILEEMLKKMSHLFKDVLEYFVLDAKKNPSEEFFGNLHLFLQEYEVSNILLDFSLIFVISAKNVSYMILVHSKG